MDTGFSYDVVADIRIGLVSISDRATKGIYPDRGTPALHDWLNKAISSKWQAFEALVADEQKDIEAVLCKLVDEDNCCLILTTGGTGPAKRDVTPDATLNICDRVLDGFGEQMRTVSLKYVPTAILSRQVAVTRGKCLIINLPGQPKAIAETLEGVFAAVPYCIDLLEGPRLETNEEVIKTFRPKEKSA